MNVMDFSLTPEHFEEKIIPFLDTLKKKEYSESCCKWYKSALHFAASYIFTDESSKYSKGSSESFLNSALDALMISDSYKKHIRTAIRRFDDYLNGNSYVFREPRLKPILSGSYEELLLNYEQVQLKRGLRISTIECRLIFARQFLMALEKQNQFYICELTGQQVGAAILSLNSQGGAYAKLPYFLKYLFKHEKTGTNFSNIIPHFIEDKKLPTIYERSELVSVLSAIDTSTISGKRDYALFMMLVSYGLRASDITHLMVKDIDFQHNCFSFIQSKTGEPYRADLILEVSAALKRYITEIAIIDNNVPFFCTTQAPFRMLTRSAIWSIVSKRLNEVLDIGNRKHGSHSIRSSLASRLIEEDVPYAMVQKILGHKDPNATKRYAAIDIEKLRICALECPVESGAFASCLEGGMWK